MKSLNTPTLSDVAREAGVSLATVSRVLSGSHYAVSSAAREKVLAAAEKLHYLPDSLGKSLKTRQTHTVGVVLPSLTNPYYAQLFQGISDAALRKNWRVLLCSAHRNAELERRSIDILLSERVAGILLASISPDTVNARRALDRGCALITLEQELDLPCAHVGFDYQAGGRLATGHLIEQGHRKIGFVGAPPDRPSRRAMLAGYREAMQSHGLEISPAWIWPGTDETDSRSLYEIDNGTACARYFLSLTDSPTACVCLNDITAMGLIHALRELSVSVPRDFSVVGFDNIPVGALYEPPLTTVEQHAADLGAAALDRLIAQIESGSPSEERLYFAPELIKRGSTGAI